MTNQRGFAPILIILMLAFLVGGYLVYTNYSNNRTKPIPSPQPTTQPSPTLDPTANWKTYNSAKFSFSYPPTMYIQNETTNEVVWKSDYVPGSFTYGSMILRWQADPYQEPTKGVALSVYETGNEQLKKLSAIITSVDETLSISLNGKAAKLYTITCGVDCYYHMVQFQQGSSHYRLIFDGAGGGLLQIFNQILSTFKFLP